MSEVAIRNGGLEARVSSKGAQLTSLALGGVEYLWQGDPRWWKGQSPVLFPIVGTLRDGRAESASGEVRLGRHGLARDYEHKILEVTDDSATFELRSSSDTLERFPFEFALRMTYSLDGKSLTQTFEVENPGSVDLPYVVGGHPAFNVPVPGAGDSFEDYAVHFSQPIKLQTPFMDPVTGLIDFDRLTPRIDGSNELPITHETFSADALVLHNVPDNTVTLVGAAGHGVRVDFPGFDWLGIWSAANDAPFVAIEPWRGIATCEDEGDAFEEKRGMELLASGGVARHSYRMTPL